MDNFSRFNATCGVNLKILLIAWQGVRADAVKSALLILTLSLGMLGFVSVVAAERVLLDSVSQRAILAGGPSATFVVLTSRTSETINLERFSHQLGVRVGAAASSVQLANPEVYLWVDNRPNLAVGVDFVSRSLVEVRPFVTLEGTWFGARELLAPMIVLNRLAAEQLEAADVIQLGSSSLLKSANVIGVVEDGQFEPRAYVPLSYADLWPSSNTEARVLLTAPNLTEGQIDAATQHLFDFGSRMQAVDISQLDTMGRLAQELTATTRVLLVLGYLSLIATMLAIANMGLTTAVARAKEFDLRQAFGANRWQIASITIVESQILASISAIIASALSYAVYPLVVEVFDAPSGVQLPSYSLDYAALCVGVASATALVSSIVPALISYRKDLSNVMRQ